MDSFTSDAPHDCGHCRKAIGFRRNTHPSLPARAPAAGSRRRRHARPGRAAPLRTNATRITVAAAGPPTPHPPLRRPCQGTGSRSRGRHPTGGRREWRTRPSPHAPTGKVWPGAPARVGREGPGRRGRAGGEEEETMHEASPRGGSRWSRPKAGGPGRSLGPEPAITLDRIRREEEEGNHARGVPARGSRGSRPKAGGSGPLLGPEPVSAWTGIRRREEEEETMHEAPPRGGAGRRPEGPAAPWAGAGDHPGPEHAGRRGRETMHEAPPRGGCWGSRPKAGGSGLSSRTPAARLRRCRPIRMTSQEANPC